MIEKDIHIGDVLSAHSGRIIGPNGMNGVWEVAFHLISPEIGPGGLFMFAKNMKAMIQEQHPWLADVSYDVDINSDEDAERFWKSFVGEHGECLTLVGPDHDR